MRKPRTRNSASTPVRAAYETAQEMGRTIRKELEAELTPKRRSAGKNSPSIQRWRCEALMSRSHHKALGIGVQFATLGDSAHGGRSSTGQRSAIRGAGARVNSEMRIENGSKSERPAAATDWPSGTDRRAFSRGRIHGSGKLVFPDNTPPWPVNHEGSGRRTVSGHR